MSVADFYDAFDKTQPPERPATVHPISPGRASRYATRALEDEVQRVQFAVEGTRNHTLNNAAFNMAQLVSAGHIGEQDVRDSLAQAAYASGLEEREIIATLNSGFRSGITQPRVVEERRPDSGAGLPTPSVLSDGELEPDERAQVVRDAFPILDWHDLWEQEDDEEWILKPLLPARRLVALYSAPKVGKSLLMLEIAAGLAVGRTVLSVDVERPHRVLYVDFENDPRGDIRARLKAMGYGPDDLANLCYLSFPSLAALDTTQGGFELMAVVETYGCKVVVIDTVSRAIKGEENENDTWLNFYRHTGKALKAAGVALVRLDHSGKDEGKGQRGGSAKSGDVDAVWRMSTVTETTFRLECEANRMPVTDRSMVLYRRPLPHLHHESDADPKRAMFEAKVADVLQHLEDLELPPDTSERKAREEMKRMGLSSGTEALRTAIRRRKAAAGLVIHSEEGDE